MIYAIFYGRVINRALKRARRGLIPDNRIIFLSHDKKVSRAFLSLINEMPFINGNYHAALITEIFSRYLHPTKMQFVNSANLCVCVCLCVHTCVHAYVCVSVFLVRTCYLFGIFHRYLRRYTRTCTNMCEHTTNKFATVASVCVHVEQRKR